MTDFSFIHSADLHLDSPLRGLRRMEGAPDIQYATRHALEKLVQLALDEDVAFVVIAGDLYDGDWPDYRTGLFFSAQMKRLEAANIQVFIVHGNHDAESQISKQLRLPQNVHVFDHAKPETQYIHELHVALHGQSFAVRDVTDNLASQYPLTSTGFLNIGILHTALTGRAGHAPYAPCALDDLTSKAYDYWALGHVHQYEEVCTDPWVVYSGNIQGRHSRETGDKGCVLVKVQDLHIQSVQHCALQLIRWHCVKVDVSPIDDENALLTTIEQRLSELPQEEGIVRIHLHGESTLHHRLKSYSEDLHAEFINHTPSHLWLEKVKIATQAQTNIAQGNDDSLDLLSWSNDLMQEEIEHYANEFQKLKNKLPVDILKSFDPCDTNDITDLCADVESLLRSRMNGETS